MNKWQETVKRVSKEHPGKSLREILPIAKLEYKKMGHSSSAPTKKHKKHHKKSHSHKRKGSRKGRKGRKGSRRMRGGSNCGSNCGSSDTTQETVANAGQGPVGWGPDDNWNGESSSVSHMTPQNQNQMVGGSHCGTHGRRRRRRRPTRRRGPKRRRMRGGQCPGTTHDNDD